MAQPARQRMTFAEFLAFEETAEIKHEWLDGAVVAMSGGTRVHALLQARAITAFSNALGKGGCQVYSSDLMVRIPTSGLATYPDVTVVCGPFQGDADNAEAATNPVVLVEVLSPSTERWDRGGKFSHFQQLHSLREYVLVNQDRQWVECYVRQDDGSWTYRTAGPGDLLDLVSLGVKLDISELYDQTGVPALEMPPLRLGEPEPTWAVLTPPQA